MGTASYICEGKASPESFESCSHGAGRAMGREQAVRTIPRERVIQELADRDVRLFKAKKHDLAEEAPEAYKDIEQVLGWERTWWSLGQARADRRREGLSNPARGPADPRYGFSRKTRTVVGETRSSRKRR